MIERQAVRKVCRQEARQQVTIRPPAGHQQAIHRPFAGQAVAHFEIATLKSSG